MIRLDDPCIYSNKFKSESWEWDIKYIFISTKKLCKMKLLENKEILSYSCSEKKGQGNSHDD